MRACAERARPRRPPRPPRPPRAALLYWLLLLCARAAWCGGLLGANIVCARGLTERQRALCHAAPAAVAATGIGLSMAYAECRAQLAGRRWNCSAVGDDARLGHVLPLATKEAAFTYAITAAGVTHALSAACARGDLPACSCASNRRRGRVGGAAEQFEWGGCGEASFGARFARRFLDARELEADARAAMNLHNNRVGRKLVKEMVHRECKCHGVSGSCAVRTCWRALPPFGAVGAALRDKYRRAKLVAADDERAPPHAPLHPPAPPRARAAPLRQARLLLRRAARRASRTWCTCRSRRPTASPTPPPARSARTAATATGPLRAKTGARSCAVGAGTTRCSWCRRANAAASFTGAAACRATRASRAPSCTSASDRSRANTLLQLSPAGQTPSRLPLAGRQRCALASDQGKRCYSAASSRLSLTGPKRCALARTTSAGTLPPSIDLKRCAPRRQSEHKTMYCV